MRRGQSTHSALWTPHIKYSKLPKEQGEVLEGHENWRYPQTISILKRGNGPSHRAQGKWPPHRKGLYQHLSREHLQQLDEHPPVPQVLVEVSDATGHTGQVRVHPFRESLLLNNFPLIWVGRRVPGEVPKVGKVSVHMGLEGFPESQGPLSLAEEVGVSVPHTSWEHS